MSIEIAIKLNDPALLREVAAKKPVSFALRNNMIDGVVDVHKVESLREAIEMLQVIARKDSVPMDPALVYAKKIEDAIREHLGKTAKIDTISLECELIENYNKVVIFAELPPLKPLSSYIRVHPMGTSPHVYEAKCEESPLFKWLFKIFDNEHITICLFKEILQFCGEAYYSAVCFAMSRKDLCVGDLIVDSSCKGTFVVTNRNDIRQLRCDKYGHAIMPAEMTKNVEDPIKFWDKYCVYYVELGVEHPKNKYGRTMTFAVDNGGYEKPCGNM